MQKTHLSHKHLHTLQQIFQHPASHNLEWHDVVALVNQLGTAQEGDNGHLTFTLNGISEVFKRSLAKDVTEIQEVLDIRRFLAQAGIKADGAITLQEHTHSPEVSPEPEPISLAEEAQNTRDQGHLNREQNRHAEQQLKTQQNEQNERSAFQAGNAQAHQQGNRQK